jgi:hypothetical protein
MFHLIRKLAVTAAFSAAVLVGKAAPGPGNGASPIANGHVATVGMPAGITSTTFSMVMLPNGSIVGNGISSNTLGGWVHFDLTSFVFIGDTLLVAGPSTASFNAPPQFVVGGTFFLALKDNGNGGGNPAPDELANGAAPFPVTAQQILAMFGPPPPAAFRPALSGNLVIH